MTLHTPKILLAASETTPLVKVGGLGDVIGALPKALREAGVDARIILPKYRQIDAQRFPMEETSLRFTVPFDGVDHVVRVFTTTLPNSDVTVYLLDHPHYEGVGDAYYQHVLAGEDPSVLLTERFLFFSRAIVAFLESSDWKPDVLHCHDWHTAATPFFLRNSTSAVRTIFTIHNLASVGTVSAHRWNALCGAASGVPPLRESNTTQHDTYGAVASGTAAYINLTDLALGAADIITTVSPTYAQEILTLEFGCGFERILQHRQRDLVGILNGIDTTVFNPATDAAITRQYSVATLEKKRDNTIALTSQLHLVGTGPLYGMVSRFTEQKGVGLVLSVVPQLIKEQDANIVLLGAGDPVLEQAMRHLAEIFPDHIVVHTAFEADFAQRIYASADMFLMPSQFEPCGLGQLIALRYGTVPIVHAVGGLRDTVHEGATGNGFVFDEFTPEAFHAACTRAWKEYTSSAQWRTLQHRGMSEDFSWTASARSYSTLYHQLLSHAATTK